MITSHLLVAISSAALAWVFHDDLMPVHDQFAYHVNIYQSISGKGRESIKKCRNITDSQHSNHSPTHVASYYASCLDEINHGLSYEILTPEGLDNFNIAIDDFDKVLSQVLYVIFCGQEDGFCGSYAAQQSLERIAQVYEVLLDALQDERNIMPSREEHEIFRKKWFEEHPEWHPQYTPKSGEVLQGGDDNMFR
ncbi:MAG: hypothetical protein HQL51_10545 [Magnetococcales bacterium]|nr:hypothetical protein [Magnetococcales bacterium]